MIISIAGTPGSGKTTIAKILSRKLGYRSYDMGGLRRKMARERGMTLAEFNRLGEQEAFTDQEVDDYQKKLGQEEDNFIIQGRTSFFFIPRSIKVFIHADPDVGAERIWNDLRTNPAERNEGRVRSLAELRRIIAARIQSDNRRYRKYYNIDVHDPAHYDLVIDSTHRTATEVAGMIIDFINKRGPRC